MRDIAVAGRLVALQARVAVLHDTSVVAHQAPDEMSVPNVHLIIWTRLRVGELRVGKTVEESVGHTNLSHQTTHVVGRADNLRHGHTAVDHGGAFHLAHQAAHIGVRLV